jgi:hypothetical protein
MRAWSRRYRSWIWCALSDLLEANLVTELARLEAAASPFPEAARKYELVRARAEELRFEVTAMVDRLGTADERDRLNALLGVRTTSIGSGDQI